MGIEDLLKRIHAKDLIGSYGRWGKNRLNPYSNKDLTHFVNQSDRDFADENTRFSIFRSKYLSLAPEDKVSLEDWAVKSFGNPVWVKEIGPRPEWIWNNFLSKRSGKYLDIGCCHGLHSNIFFKNKRSGNFEYFSCDLLPAYLKLQMVCGIDSRMWHSRKTDISELFHDVKFDVVVCSEILEHIRDEDEKLLLSSLSKICAPGCDVLITFPKDAKVERTDLESDPLGHIHQPKVEEVIDRLGNDFIIVDSKSVIKSWNNEQQVIIAKKV
jgi:2-polyprenyl-3-methyl-5-hydroxy-6-metoxy-1,4-benzoquinol methylase